MGGTKQDLVDAYAIVKEAEQRLTINKSTSELVDINNAAGHHAVKVSSATYRLVKQAVLISQERFGFNVAIGPLVNLWRIGFTDAHRPTNDEIDDARRLTNVAQIALNDQERSVFLRQRGMQIDLGALAKGQIADDITELWQSHGVKSGQINLGGSNIVLLGSTPDQKRQLWRIGIQEPAQNDQQYVMTVGLPACSVGTSGVYERFLNDGGNIYHHILDDRTGFPLKTDLLSATVFTQTALASEKWSSKMFFAGFNTTFKPDNEIFGAVLINRNKQIRVLGLDPSEIRMVDRRYRVCSKHV